MTGRGAGGRRVRACWARVPLVGVVAVAVAAASVAVLTVVGVWQHAVTVSATPLAPLTVTAPVAGGGLRDTLAVNASWQPLFTVPVASPRLPAGSVAIVTDLPMAAGQTLAAGQVVVWVAGRPVIVLPGAVPMYRDIRSGDTGTDVKQLQSALNRLGLRAGDSGRVDPATAAAVAALYQRVGAQPAAQLGAAIVPLGEVAFVPAGRAVVESLSAETGRPAGPAVAVLRSRKATLRAVTPADEPAEIRAGMTVEALTGAGNLVGQVTAVKHPTQDAGDDRPAQLVLDLDIPDLPRTQAGVPISVLLDESEPDALSVPATAILTMPDGTYQVAVARESQVQRIPVTLGLRSRGRVVVTPHAPLSAGDAVIVAGPSHEGRSDAGR